MGLGCGNASLPRAACGPIIGGVAQFRRLHVPALRVGELALDPAQARHARGPLRLEEGAAVEVFDEAGNVATGTLVYRGAHGASVHVTEVRPPAGPEGGGFSWAVASAVPKGERADWMVEKLSELGAAAFVPLITARSVVHPEGRGKRDRWQRLATESAKQSRRAGVMRIEELTRLEVAVQSVAAGEGFGFVLSTEADAQPLSHAMKSTLLRTSRGQPDAEAPHALTFFVGPEGGWTDEERALMGRAGLTPVRLTPTILRVETAAVAAAAVMGCLQLELNPAPPIAREALPVARESRKPS
jgi:16S rRNA (uracil1498-N3)-methyltransferase